MSSTTTIRLSDEDRLLLAELVPEFGDQSSVIRHGIRMLAQESRRWERLEEVLAAWEAEAGPVDEAEVDSMRRRYFDR
jgi:Arc/MetJ-type ribon-helix-helix transcriptional regulator